MTSSNRERLLRANRPAQLARERLGEALGKMQDVGDPGVDLEKPTSSIAGAVNALFAVQSSRPGDAQHVSGVLRAMGHLRDALETMQDAGGEDPSFGEATRTVARTLAMLYPISKVQERQSLQPDSPISVLGEELPEDPRRGAPRVTIKADIGFESENNFFTGYSEDISSGGIFIATFDPCPISSTIAVGFTLPDGHLVSAEGVVRWVREYNETAPETQPGMGVQFQGLSDEDRDRINSFLEKREPIFFDE
ncbi:MAG: TIGR02266 family protein [Polyangia bacterium]